ncbi:MAG TPA: hypothetical protein VIC26_04065 [Marinagarivorans sp.]
MKTRDILLSDEKSVTAQLKTMKIKELERHAKKILAQLGQPDYDKVMAAVIKKIPTLNATADRFESVQSVIKGYLPDQLAASSSSALERITVLITVLVAKKFNKILIAQR